MATASETTVHLANVDETIRVVDFVVRFGAGDVICPSLMKLHVSKPMEVGYKPVSSLSSLCFINRIIYPWKTETFPQLESSPLRIKRSWSTLPPILHARRIYSLRKPSLERTKYPRVHNLRPKFSSPKATISTPNGLLLKLNRKLFEPFGL